MKQIKAVCTCPICLPFKWQLNKALEGEHFMEVGELDRVAQWVSTLPEDLTPDPITDDMLPPLI